VGERNGRFRRRPRLREENEFAINISPEEYPINPVLFSESATMAAQRRVVDARARGRLSMESLERAMAGEENCHYMAEIRNA